MEDGMEDWKVGYERVREMVEVPGLYIALSRTVMGQGQIARCTSDSVIDTWMYPYFEQAASRFETWNGYGDAPDGWVRCVESPYAHRRRVAGDPLKEYRKS